MNLYDWLCGKQRRCAIVSMLCVVSFVAPSAGQPVFLPPPDGLTPFHGPGVFAGEFQTGLSYRLATAAEGNRIDVYVSNHTNRSRLINFWVATFDEKRTLQDVGYYWTRNRLEPNQADVVLTAQIPLPPTPWSFHRVAYWEGTGPLRPPQRTAIFSMVEPGGGATLRYETPEFQVTFAIIPQQIGFTLRNNTSAPIKIIWDECAYLDQTGRSHRVIHEGIRFTERDRPMAPTIVPPGARLDDLFYPASYISWTGQRWDQRQLYNDTASTPFSIGLFITLEVLGQKRTLSFRFAAALGWSQQVKDLFAGP